MAAAAPRAALGSRDPSATSPRALLGTAPGRRMAAQALARSRGYRDFARYRAEAGAELPALGARVAARLREAVGADGSPAEAAARFAEEAGDPNMALGEAEARAARERVLRPGAAEALVASAMDSNFVRMTYPVFSALYDAAGSDPALKRDVLDGHIVAIDLSEPMDRITDRDEGTENLDEFRLACPHMLAMARSLISAGGPAVLRGFEEGFAEARAGQALDAELKSRPGSATYEEMHESYKKYRSVMGTAGRNMALASGPAAEAFYSGMAHAAQGVGCGNEMEDSLRLGAVKSPSWPLYYSALCGDPRRGFSMALGKALLCLGEARLSLGMLPPDFTHRAFLEFVFLSVEHYVRLWHGRAERRAPWAAMRASLPGAPP